MSRLRRPEVGDGLPADQLLNPFIFFGDCELSKSVSSVSRERYLPNKVEKVNFVPVGL